MIDAYFPHLRKPDGKDELDVEEDKDLKHAIKKSTGMWQIWREVHISALYQESWSDWDISLPHHRHHAGQGVSSKLVDKSGGAATRRWRDTTEDPRAPGAAVPAGETDAVKPGDQEYHHARRHPRIAGTPTSKPKLKAANGLDHSGTEHLADRQALAPPTAYEASRSDRRRVVVKTCNEYFDASEASRSFT